MATDGTITLSDSEQVADPDAPRNGWGREQATPIGERRVWRVVVGVAIATTVIGGFIVAAWSLEWFREGIGVLAPYLPGALYAAVGVLLVVTAALRLLHVNVRLPDLRLVAGPLALCGAVVAYLAPLVDKWENGARGGYSAIAGVIPWSDASAYFTGAESLLFDGHLDDWNSRRPLNAAFLADRLALTNLDLRLSLVVQAILLGVACYVAARTVARDFGPIAGLALFAGIYSFASFGVETTLSESLAVTLGAFAFATLWNAVRERSVWLSAGGLLLLALALSTRPGTVVLLLVLPLFFAFYLREETRINLRVLGIGAAAIVAAFGFNVLTAAILDGTPSNLNGSFYPTLYGLAKGNDVWTRVYSDYPELEEMSEPRANRFIRAKALEEIRHHPGNFIDGLASSTNDYFKHTREISLQSVQTDRARRMLYAAAAAGSALAVCLRWRRSRWFVLVDLVLFAGVVLAVTPLFGLWVREHGIGEWLPLGFAVFGYVAFVVCGTDRLRSPIWSFAAATFVGILLSLALTTIRDIGPRVYAATVPFFALAFAGAVAVIARLVTGAQLPALQPPRASRKRSWTPAVIGLSIVAVAVFATPVAMATVSEPQLQSRTCPDGRRAVAVTGGVAVHLVGNESQAESELNELDVANYSAEATEIASLIQGLPPNVTVLQALPLRTRPYFVLAVVDGFVEAPGRSLLYLCGQTRDVPGRATSESELPVFFGTPLRS